MKTKKCPYCSEEILIDAIKCKHCHEFLNDKNSLEHTQNRNSSQTRKNSTSNLFLIITIVILVFVIGIYTNVNNPDLYTLDSGRVADLKNVPKEYKTDVKRLLRYRDKLEMYEEAGNKSEKESLSRLIEDFEIEKPMASAYYYNVYLTK